ncbi:hypothetical protein SEPCBS119000_004052 [Sporothrix epigloea]|uniref:Uncharacterized protein n=1 Tax=Sporothrix epigloea TaxID=1892477 RepID=A0ABP0DQ00_9PEZI
MDVVAPPAKRRRTSPRLSSRGSSEPQSDSVNTRAATTIPPTDTTTQPPSFLPQTSKDAEPQSSQTRNTSFASPTRASLARRSPATLESRPPVPRASSELRMEVEIDVLPRQSSIEKARETAVRLLQQPAVRSPVRQLSPTRPLSLPALRSPVRVTSSRSGSPARRQFGGGSRESMDVNGLFTAPPQRSPEMSASRHRQPKGQAGSAIIASSMPSSLLDQPPRRTPVKPVPRPLPPPDPQRSQDLLEPLMARDRQRSVLETFRVREEAQPEPELPPTPENVDMSALLSPPGIHFSSTPTKRPRRAAPARTRGVQNGKPGIIQKSSPLKQPSFKIATTDTTRAAIGDAGALRETSVNVPTPLGRGRTRKSDAARKIQPADKNTQQLRKLDVLRAEIAELEADLALAKAENARVRNDLEHDVGKHSSIAPIDSKKIINLLRRRALPEDDMSETTPMPAQSTTDWLRAAINPIAFLPFGKPRADVTELLLFPSEASDLRNEQQLPAPVSHHPIEMSAAEELPFLQVFTPLAFRSDIVILPEPDTDALESGALQKHIITASSTTPPGVFLARIEMTVHSRSLRITDLAVPRIEPPAAAAELGPLIDCVTREHNGSSALTRNITILTWAMGEWVRVAVRRAKFWSVLARRLRDKQSADTEEGAWGVSGLVKDIRRLRTKQRKKKRPTENTTESDDDSGDETGNTCTVSVSQVEMLEHLGRTAMDIAVTAVSSIRVEWTIQFDWTGEAKSRMALLVGVPGKWRKADKRGRLARLPKLFDQLVQDSGDPMVAVQTVVALLVGDDD